MKKNLIKLTVVVCTYNRPLELRKCLNSLKQQKVGRDSWEILVIDNNSSYNVKSIVNSIGLEVSVDCIYETRQGLSNARNRGFRKASGRFVAYIDDDSVADCNWVKNIFNFVKRRPRVQAFGGPYFQLSDNKKTRWFPSTFDQWYLGDKERRLIPMKEWLSGTNMVYKRDLLIKLGGFRPNLGMKGKKILYGEETYLQKRIYDLGISIYYCPNIYVRHMVSKKKMSLVWLLKHSFVSGRTTAKIFGKRKGFNKHYASFRLAYENGKRYFKESKGKPLIWRTYLLFKDLFSEFGILIESST